MSMTKHLFHLVVEIRVLSFEHQVFLKPVHISGDCMIVLVIEGISRGERDADISLGWDMRACLPLDKAPFFHESSGLLNWIRNWSDDPSLTPISPVGWFSNGHCPGLHLWAPPPAASLSALNQLGYSKLKWPYELMHIFV